MRRWRLIVISALALIAAITGASLLYASDSSSVATTATQSITAFGVCKKITNTSPTGKTVYVPTQSSAEWASFYTHPPVGVSISSCGCMLPWGGTASEGQSVTAFAAASASYGGCVSETRTCTSGALSGSYQYSSCSMSCSGTVVGGYCWYQSGYSQSCDTACSSHNGCNLAGTGGYAGSGGTNSQCAAVASSFGRPFVGTLPGTGGCQVQLKTGQAYRGTGATSCSVTGSVYRFCACNN